MTLATLYGQARRRWQRIINHPGDDEIPVPFPSPVVLGKLLADKGVIALMSGTSGFWAHPDRIDQRVRREVAAAVELHHAQGWIDRPVDYHRKPPELRAPKLKSVRGWWRYEHMQFTSGYEPRAGEPGRERWLDYRENRTAHAWVLRHAGEPRPWLVTIHGYRMGYPFVDFQGIRADYLHRELEMNVLAYVMPLHGPRGIGQTVGSELFTGGVANLVHGEAQAMWDLRRILSWIRRQGADVVGVKGLSLGGYTTALLAGLDDGLACAIAGIPASDFVDLFRRHMPRSYGPASPAVERFWRDARKVLRVVSPLALKPRIARDRRYIFAGLVDCLAPPPVALALWNHWERPRIAWYAGSHVSFLLEPKVRALLHEAFTESGLIAAH